MTLSSKQKQWLHAAWVAVAGGIAAYVTSPALVAMVAVLPPGWRAVGAGLLVAIASKAGGTYLAKKPTAPPLASAPPAP